jgi:hypothetical protein
VNCAQCGAIGGTHPRRARRVLLTRSDDEDDVADLSTARERLEATRR